MISIYKNFENGLQVVPELIEGAWVNVVDPSPEDIAWLRGQGVPPDYVDYSLDIDERARAERENGDVFILLRLPHFQGNNVDIPYTTLPLGIILTHNTLFTVSKYKHSIIDDFINGRVKALSTGKRHRFILRLLLATATKYLHYLRQITKIVDGLEDQLQLSTRNKELLELLKYQKSLTVFATALKSNELMMERLERSKLFQAYPEDEDLLDDVLTENQQAIEMTNISSNILSGMMDAFASIIANNLNMVMKFLTLITIILMLPTLIASIYGMNVELPFQHSPHAFLIPMLISVVLSAVAITLFVFKKWL